jgi:hypothetical protein
MVIFLIITFVPKGESRIVSNILVLLDYALNVKMDLA